MGEIEIITREQQLLLDAFRKDSGFTSQFYFSGGTALSLHYLHHRVSVDLDFFSGEKFSPQSILAKVNSWREEYKFEIDYAPLEDMQVFNLNFPNNNSVKVDFVYYPYSRIEKGEKINSIDVDSITDIAVNKLLLTQQRTEVKDFVDLYFLLEKFTVWDLMEGVKKKFKVTIDPLIVASDFLKVELFDYLPQMILPLSLKDLQTFFRQKAKAMGMKGLE